MQEFSVRIHNDQSLQEDDSNVKPEVVSALLRTAVTKTRFYIPSVERVKTPRYIGLPIRKPMALKSRPFQPPPRTYTVPAALRLNRAKTYIQQARGLGCSATVADAVIDRVTDTHELNVQFAHKCLRSVMLPLFTFLLQHSRLDGDLNIQLPSKFGELQRTIVTLLLDAADISQSGKIGESEVVEIFEVAIANSNAALFGEM